MGIKNLRQLIKRYNISLFEKFIPFQNFANKTVLLDASLYICKYKATAKNHKFEESFIYLFETLKSAKINVVVVFDGTSPKEKSDEREKRRERKEQAYVRVETLEREISNYEKTKTISDVLQDAISKVNFPSSIILPKRLTINNQPELSKETLRKLKEYVTKQKSYLFEITSADFESVEQLCNLLGIPVLHAPGEAEIFCAHLVKKGQADAVITKDSDVLACSTPIVITDINFNSQMFTVIETNKLLELLNLNETEFLDLCILCGTDYNSNIKGIGPVKALSLINKYHSLNIIEDKEKSLNINSLNYEVVRNLFACPENLESIKIPENKKVDVANLEEYINKNSIKLPLHLRTKLQLTTGKLYKTYKF